MPMYMPGAFADGFEAFEDGDVLGAVRHCAESERLRSGPPSSSRARFLRRVEIAGLNGVHLGALVPVPGR